MNEIILKAVNEACGVSCDPFEAAFSAAAPKHKFSRKHKRDIDVIIRNCNDPEKARARLEREPFFAGFGIKQLIAAAASILVIGGLTVGGSYVVDQIKAMVDVNANYNKRYDELLRDGRYYLNGDKSSGICFEAADGNIALCGDRDEIAELFYNGSIAIARDRDTEEKQAALREWALTTADNFMSGSQIAIVKTNGASFGIENEAGDGFDMIALPDYAFIWHPERVDGRLSDYIITFGYSDLTFDGDKTLNIWIAGDFVLTE